MIFVVALSVRRSRRPELQADSSSEASPGGTLTRRLLSRSKQAAKPKTSRSPSLDDEMGSNNNVKKKDVTSCHFQMWLQLLHSGGTSLSQVGSPELRTICRQSGNWKCSVTPVRSTQYRYPPAFVRCRPGVKRHDEMMGKQRSFREKARVCCSK